MRYLINGLIIDNSDLALAAAAVVQAVADLPLAEGKTEIQAAVKLAAGAAFAALDEEFTSGYTQAIFLSQEVYRYVDKAPANPSAVTYNFAEAYRVKRGDASLTVTLTWLAQKYADVKGELITIFTEDYQARAAIAAAGDLAEIETILAGIDW